MFILIDILILCLVFGLVYWVVTLIPIPGPFKNVALAIVAIIFLIYLLGFLFGMVPVPHPLLR